MNAGYPLETLNAGVRIRKMISFYDGIPVGDHVKRFKWYGDSATRFNHPEFIYREPVMVPVRPMPSIKTQYLDAIIGNNSKYVDEFKTTDCYHIKMDVERSENPDLTFTIIFKAWLLSNEYTEAKKDKQIAEFEYIKSRYDCGDLGKEILFRLRGALFRIKKNGRS